MSLTKRFYEDIAATMQAYDEIELLCPVEFFAARHDVRTTIEAWGIKNPTEENITEAMQAAKKYFM